MVDTFRTKVEFISLFKVKLQAIWLSSYIPGLEVVDTISKQLGIYYDNFIIMFSSKNNKRRVIAIVIIQFLVPLKIFIFHVENIFLAKKYSIYLPKKSKFIVVAVVVIWIIIGHTFNS